MGDPNNSNRAGNTIIATNHAGYTGDGFLGNNNNVNSGFTVLAPIDFTSVTLRYAASSANDGEYYLNVIQTETTQFSGDTTTFAKTGDWANWDEVTIELSGSVGDYLNFAFANTTNDGGVNVDSIEFTPIPELSTSALIMGLGAVCIMFLKRRRFYAGKLKI